MKQLQPDYYFDLASFTHKELFISGEKVWFALSQINKYLKEKKLEGIQVNVPRGTFFENQELVSVGEGTVIEEGAFIRGPCIIGRNCIIRHGAYIRGGVITGDDCVIGHATEVKNSILLNGAQAPHFAYLGDTILGNHVNLGAGTKCANLKLDHGTIEVRLEGETFSTERKKLGAIIGDRTQLGCNSVTNPGALIGPNVSSYPCVVISGVIPAGKTIKPKEKAVVS